MSAEHLALIAERLNVRTLWLATGRGVPHVERLAEEIEREMLLIASLLEPYQCRTWLAIGRNLPKPSAPHR